MTRKRIAKSRDRARKPWKYSGSVRGLGTGFPMRLGKNRMGVSARMPQMAATRKMSFAVVVDGVARRIYGKSGIRIRDRKAESFASALRAPLRMTLHNLCCNAPL